MKILPIPLLIVFFSYTTLAASEYDQAALHGLQYIWSHTQTQTIFNDFGSDLLWCYFTISRNAKDPMLKKQARFYALKTAQRWHRHVSTDVVLDNKDDFIDAVMSIYPLRQLAINTTTLEKRLKQKSQQFTIVDHYCFNPVTHPPTQKCYEPCEVCGHENKHASSTCEQCHQPLTPRNKYDVYLDALITSYFSHKAEFHLGVSLINVLKWITTFRPYQSLSTIGQDAYDDQIYMVTHYIYVLNDYGQYQLPQKYFKAERNLLKQALPMYLKKGDLETAGEITECLYVLGESAFVNTMQAKQILLQGQHPNGSWSSSDDIYDQYHTTWTAIDALLTHNYSMKQLSNTVKQTIQ